MSAFDEGLGLTARWRPGWLRAERLGAQRRGLSRRGRRLHRGLEPGEAVRVYCKIPSEQRGGFGVPKSLFEQSPGLEPGGQSQGQHSGLPSRSSVFEELQGQNGFGRAEEKEKETTFAASQN